MIGASNGHSRIVKLLLDAGADVTRRDRGGRTAAEMIKGNDSREMMRLFEQSRDKSQKKQEKQDRLWETK